VDDQRVRIVEGSVHPIEQPLTDTHLRGSSNQAELVQTSTAVQLPLEPRNLDFEDVGGGTLSHPDGIARI